MRELFVRVYGKCDRLVNRIVNRLRLVRLYLLGANIGTGVRVYGRFVVIGDARKLSIGNGSTINEGVIFDLRHEITIGSNVRLSAFVQLRTSKLAMETSRRDGHMGGPIVIEDGVWLAGGVLVSPGVTIGTNSVIGANAVVTHDIASSIFAAGLPARPVKNLRQEM
jgi:acetyltransferase-like isoleucine patch superfamily enzyme